jgi:hypothetical protein
MEELWKPVVNYEGYYEVSNQGNVRRVGGRQLKPVLDNKYLEVNLCVKSKRKKFRVHQLVAFAFLSECPGEYGRGKGKYQIDHKNDNHLDNRAENLQWLLHGDNCFWKHEATHPFRTRKVLRGVKHGMAKLTEAQVLAIRNDNRFHRVIAKEYGVDNSLVSQIKRRVCWTHLD